MGCVAVVVFALRDPTMSNSAATDVDASSAAPPILSAVETAGATELRLPPPRVRFPSVIGCATPAGRGRCVHVSCRYHLAHPDRGARLLSATRDCALLVANEGPHTLEEIAQVLGMTRERVRQIEETAIVKLQGKVALKRLHETID